MEKSPAEPVKIKIERSENRFQVIKETSCRTEDPRRTEERAEKPAGLRKEKKTCRTEERAEKPAGLIKEPGGKYCLMTKDFL